MLIILMQPGNPNTSFTPSEAAYVRDLLSYAVPQHVGLLDGLEMARLEWAHSVISPGAFKVLAGHNGSNSNLLGFATALHEENRIEAIVVPLSSDELILIKTLANTAIATALADRQEIRSAYAEVDGDIAYYHAEHPGAQFATDAEAFMDMMQIDEIEQAEMGHAIVKSIEEHLSR